MKTDYILVYDDEPVACRMLVELLNNEGIAAVGVEKFFEAVETVFNNPPAVFITDLAGDLWYPSMLYDGYRRENLRFESQSSGDTGTLKLIHDIQERIRETRIVLISGHDPSESATKSGVFAFCDKQIGETQINNLIAVCKLGRLREDEIDRTGKLRYGPYDLARSELSVYCRTFWEGHKERE
jgi:DNA-binding NtrC family response regulator